MPNAFGQRLVELRRTKGWTQAQLGDAAGCAAQQICRFERGLAPPTGTAVRLARALQVPPQEFVLLAAEPLMEQR